MLREKMKCRKKIMRNEGNKGEEKEQEGTKA